MLGYEFVVTWNRKSIRFISERVGVKNKKQLEGQFEGGVGGGKIVFFKVSYSIQQQIKNQLLYCEGENKGEYS